MQGITSIAGSSDDDITDPDLTEALSSPLSDVVSELSPPIEGHASLSFRSTTTFGFQSPAGPCHEFMSPLLAARPPGNYQEKTY
jgi:hypothetical protein